MDSEQYLANVFDQLTAAGTRDASVRIVVQAANELAQVDGLCMMSSVGERCVVALAQQQLIHQCDVRNSSLYRTASPLFRSEASGSRVLWGKEDCIVLPTGAQLRIGVALIVALHAASGYAAAGFFWQPGRTPDSNGTRKLQLLAKALGLSASAWQKDEEHATHQRDQRLVSADLQHRLRNNLALMRSVIRRSHETAESAEHFALHLEARVGALGRIQGASTTAGAAGVELEELVRTELIASAVPERRYSLQGPAVRLHTKGAELLALAAHELATNSLKFGAFAAQDGYLSVLWRVTAGQLPRLHLSWIESGVTIASVAPRRRGFGQEVIECTLPYELGARTHLAFSPGGVRCEVEIPLEACAISVEPFAPQLAHGGSR
jgi:two-component sensor histidine kinase